MALSQDILTRIINVHFRVDQQGLLAEYPPGAGPPGFENISEVMKGDPIAYALESERSFSGVNMGASGLGYTVLTKGLVCFGRPRNGDACFIACPDFTYYDQPVSLQRGVLGEGGNLVWSATGGNGGLQALTFAGDAFFAVYNDQSIATSFDGMTWTKAAAFSGDELPGAVASITVATAPVTRRYVSVGEIIQESDDIQNVANNLVHSVSSEGTSWNSAFNAGVLTDPGTSFRFINNYACTVAAGKTAEGNQIFVAAAAKKEEFIDETTSNHFVEWSTAAAVSEDGALWDTVKAAGAPEAGLDQRSWGMAVAYVRSKENTGYFLMTDHSYVTGEVPTAGMSSLYKSSDGHAWSILRTNSNWMATLSVIDRDLSRTTIVTL